MFVSLLSSDMKQEVAVYLLTLDIHEEYEYVKIRKRQAVIDSET